MNFTAVYVGFLIISVVHRIRRLSISYAQKKEPAEVKKSLSYAIMLFVYLLIFLGSVVEYFFINYGKGINLIVSCVGLILYLFVILLRDEAIKSLGRHISPDVEIKRDHQLVKDGPYRYVRHPLALCVTLELIALALIPNSWFSLLGVILIFFPFMLYRIRIEEEALIDKLGQEYLDYKKEVSVIFPIRRKVTM